MSDNMSLHRALTERVGATSRDHVSQDDLYEILANERRRYVLHELRETDESVEIGPLARRLAAWERDKPVDMVTAAERKSAYTALQQRHLPKMMEAGLVTFDSRSGTVHQSYPLSSLDVYAEVVPGTDVAWSQYYIGLAAVSGVIVAVDVTGLLPVPSLAPGVFCVVALVVSAVVHVRATREMRLNEPWRE